MLLILTSIKALLNMDRLRAHVEAVSGMGECVASTGAKAVPHGEPMTSVEEELRREVDRLHKRVAELEGGSAPSTEANPELKAHSNELAERVKELKCLYSSSSLLKGRHELGDILQKVADVLLPGSTPISPARRLS
jgi:hypothetical protein